MRVSLSLLWAALLLLWEPALASPPAWRDRAAASGRDTPGYAWQIHRTCGAACSATLFAVDMLAPADGWAVGDGGAILHWDGRRWQPFASPTTVTLRSIDMLSPTDGWAVGGDTGYIWTTGAILHWNGSAWQTVPAPSVKLLSVSMVAPDSGWAAGYRYLPYGHSQDILLRWDGVEWQEYAYDLDGIDVWAGVSLAAPDSGWLASQGWYEPSRLLRWDGAAWGYGDAPWIDSPITLGAVRADAIGGGWAVGNGMVRLDTLEAWPLPDVWLNAAAPAAPDDVWAVGNAGVIYRWDGAGWRRAGSPTGESLHGVDMVSATDGWAVGDGGLILRYTIAPPSPPPVYLPLLALG